MYKGKKILAIVPARLSSKRLKQKNIIKVSRGKILINWTYEAIKNSKYIDCSILSTESEKIKNLATRIGFDVPFKRPDAGSAPNKFLKSLLSLFKVSGLEYFIDGGLADPFE